ncbi:MAG: DUF881 domain-containing protein [Streptosporangiaceae bacterium]
MTDGARDHHSQNRRDPQGWQGPDASMSLLVALMRDALDPGYRAAATRRMAVGHEPPRRSTRLLLLTSVVLAGLVFSMAVVQLHREKPAAEKQRERLIAEIGQRTGRTDRLQRDLAELRRHTELLRTSRLRQTAKGARTQERLARLEMAAASVPVHGPGLEVTLDDAASFTGKPGDLADPGRVLDRDLQLVVNELWAAGAEAVSVDGQRLTSMSAIRSAGEAILVDYRPVEPPYTIDAIGDPERLETLLADSPAGRQIRTLESNFGIRFTMRREDELRCSGASGLSLRYAHGVGARHATEKDDS